MSKKQLPEACRKDVLSQYASYEANCDAKDRETSIYRGIWEQVLKTYGLDPNDDYEHPSGT